MNQGRVVEEGSHHALLKDSPDGMYAELWQKQLQHHTGANAHTHTHTQTDTDTEVWEEEGGGGEEEEKKRKARQATYDHRKEKGK
jgi:hypothetical protein